ncbi:MAG: hypothetical protein JJT75_14935 [Opitutales bacterium]|nr:hypothetical protein [Opitutales bacterium]
MKKTQTLKALKNLQELHAQQVHPTLRDFGLKEKEIREMVDEGLIGLGDTQRGEELDRYVISEILDAGRTLLIEDSQPKLTKTIFQGLAIGVWDLGKISFGVLLGWYLNTWIKGS